MLQLPGQLYQFKFVSIWYKVISLDAVISTEKILHNTNPIPMIELEDNMIVLKYTLNNSHIKDIIISFIDKCSRLFKIYIINVPFSSSSSSLISLNLLDVHKNHHMGTMIDFFRIFLFSQLLLLFKMTNNHRKFDSVQRI